MSDDFETFFEPTRIFLFGKKFTSLRYYPESMRDEFSTKYTTSGDKATLPIPPKRIERTLRRDLSFDAEGELGKEQKEVPIFARIYSFSYEAHYYRLPRPLLFLVSDDGRPVGGPRERSNAKDPSPTTIADKPDAAGSNPPPQQGQRREGFGRRFSAEFTGVEARDWDFSNDIHVWRVDRKDLSVCLDIEVGNYQEILLDSMITSSRQDEDRATRSRGDIIGRGAGSFRGDIIGPHQNK